MGDSKALYWVRDDLRTHDNLTRKQFLNHSSPELAIFVPERYYARASTHRQKFIHESLIEFSSKLSVPIEISTRPIGEVLKSLHDEISFTHLYFSRAHAFEEVQDEKKAEVFCREHGIEICAYDQATLIHPDDLPFSLDKMPFVFTDFRKRVEENLCIRPVSVTPLPEKNQKEFIGGEQAALARLWHYLWNSQAVKTYKETRNGLLGWDDSTKLSPWLARGCLSPRTIYHEVKRFEETHGANESTYWVIFELLWRDYFKFFSRKHGAQIFQLQGVRPHQNEVIRDRNTFLQWCAGETEDDFVNAHMRELNQTGWMSNRGRQNVASYLIHDLKQPWTWGARYFEEKLIDYDPDQNWGNWLYLSGRGSDPRARRFNTKKQAQDYDPHGEYQRLWARK